MESFKSTIIILLLVFGLLTSVVQAKSPSLLLQEGLYAEETEGDLEKAIGLYEQVLEQSKDVERLAARATYQLGMCHLKKGEKEKAAKYFQQIVSNYPNQKVIAKQADEQLKKVKPETKESVFEKIDGQVIKLIGDKYGQTAAEAEAQHLYCNSHIYYVDSNFVLCRGGLSYYYNSTGRTISGKVRLSGTSYPNQTHYGVDGNKLNTEIVPDKTRPNHWQIYWIPEEPLAPEEAFYYGWSVDSTRKLPQMPGGTYTLTMQNKFGSPVIETFFLVLPKELKISQSNPPTSSQELLNFNVYWWTKQVKQGENHVVNVMLKATKISKESELANRNAIAVITTVKNFLKASIAGNETEAMKLVKPGSAVVNQLEDFTEIPNYETIQIASVHADNKKAFAVTDVIFTDNGRNTLEVIPKPSEGG